MTTPTTGATVVAADLRESVPDNRDSHRRGPRTVTDAASGLGSQAVDAELSSDGHSVAHRAPKESPAKAVAKKHVILFLAANPSETDRLALEREARAIHRELKRSGHRDRFDFRTRWAAEPLDVLSEMRELKPTVVHFSGHGGARVSELGPTMHARDVVVESAAADSDQDGLIFHDPGGGARIVSPAAIAQTLEAAGPSVRVIVLNACFTVPMAEALLTHVDCVVGMSGSIHDEAARAFAVGFYGGLGEHESIEAAFQQGRAAIHLEGLLDFEHPQLKVREGFAPTELILAAVAPALRQELHCPYPGMRPYEADDAANFHGRDAEIDEVVGRLRAGEREIFVIGPSGSGKSSLVLAGVLPRLARGAAGLGPFVVRDLRPGEQPAIRLSQALEVPAGQPFVAAERIAALLAHRGHGSSVLIVVDQLEELFTMACNEERDRLLAMLRELRIESRCSLIFTLRADLFGALMESPLWAERRGQLSRVEVSPLRGEGLCEAIVAPARDLGVAVEPELIERLLADAASEPGILPLLQETLVQLWDKRTDQSLTLTDYKRLGDSGRNGLAVAVARRADTTLRKFTPGQTALARRILLRLVSFGEGRSDMRRQQPRESLSAADDDPRDFSYVLQTMINDRLLTIDDDDSSGEPVVDLSHEILLTAWPTLGEWSRVRKDDERRRRILEAKAADWARSGRGEYRLLDADELREAAGWLSDDKIRDLGVSTEIRDLLIRSKVRLAADAAEIERRQRRRHRWVTITIMTMLIVVVVVSWLGVIAWRRTREAQRQLIHNHLSQAYAQLMNDFPQRATPYLLAAREAGANDVSIHSMFQWAIRGLPLKRFLHQGALRTVAWSPDGQRLAAASDDGAATIWDPRTGRALTTLVSCHRAISVAWSPDGRRVATASEDGTARVWNADSGEAVTPPLFHEGALRAVAWNLSGTRVATASDDKTARVWDAQTGQAITPPLTHRGIVRTVSWNHDGTRVATASDDETAQIWDAETGRAVGRPLLHHGYDIGAVWSPDGRRLATVGKFDTVYLWDADTGEMNGPMLTHRMSVESIAWDPTGKWIATGSGGGMAQVWNTGTGKVLTYVRTGHPSSILGTPSCWVKVMWSPEGGRLLTSCDSDARVWEAMSGKPLTPALAHQGWVTSMAWHPEGRFVATGGLDHAVRLWDTEGLVMSPPLRHGDAVRALAWSPDGTRVATASLDHTARVWDAHNGQPLTPPLTHENHVFTVAWSPDGKQVATSSSDGTARVWDAGTGQALISPLVHHATVRSVAWSPDGRWLATASTDGIAQIWDARSGRRSAPPLIHRDGVTAVAWSPDGTRIVTAGVDHAARVWSATTGQPVTTSPPHPAFLNAIAWSPDGRRIATASFGAIARVWEADSGEAVTSPLMHNSQVNALAWSPDGHRLVTISDDGYARVWDANNGEIVAPPLFVGHFGGKAVAWSPDGERVATAGFDGIARIWDSERGQAVSQALGHRYMVGAVSWSPDGLRLATASDDNTARIWNVSWDSGDLADWRDTIEQRCDYRLNDEGVLVSRDPRAPYGLTVR
jgi:WD40 repeat protein